MRSSSVSPSLGLAAALRRAAYDGSVVGDETLRAVRAFARDARAAGQAPMQVVASVRRSLAQAAPSLTVTEHEIAAGRLVRHALFVDEDR